MILFVGSRDVIFFVLPIIVLLGAVFLLLSWFLNRSAKNKEKLLLLEKGIDANEINSITEKRNNTTWLRTGIVMIGVAIGYFINTLIYNPSLGFGLATILLSTGISMIIAHYAGKTNYRH